jgi:hypothetical protein
MAQTVQQIDLHQAQNPALVCESIARGVPSILKMDQCHFGIPVNLTTASTLGTRNVDQQQRCPGKVGDPVGDAADQETLHPPAAMHAHDQ